MIVGARPMPVSARAKVPILPLLRSLDGRTGMALTIDMALLTELDAVSAAGDACKEQALPAFTEALHAVIVPHCAFKFLRLS